MWGFGLSFNIADNYQIGISGGVGITPLAKFGNRDKKCAYTATSWLSASAIISEPADDGLLHLSGLFRIFATV